MPKTSNGRFSSQISEAACLAARASCCEHRQIQASLYTPPMQGVNSESALARLSALRLANAIVALLFAASADAQDPLPIPLNPGGGLDLPVGAQLM